MNFETISASDWEHFNTEYREAAAFLRNASLIGEWENLLSTHYPLNDWQKNRLAELTDLFTKQLTEAPNENR